MRNSLLASAFMMAALLAATTAASAQSPSDLVAPSSLAECFLKKTPSTPMIQHKAKPGPYRIALSNSYFANDWRLEMLNIARAYVKQPAVAYYVRKFDVQNSGNNVAQQVAQIRQMILSGYDAIVVNTASPSGLNNVINEAVDRGIVVVTFDNTATTHKAININENQYEMGVLWARFIAKEVGGKGKVLMVRGLAGTTVDNDQGAGGMDVFKKYPNIKIIQVYGNWEVGTNQKVAADALATNHDLVGVWGTDAMTGTLQAFLQLHAKLVPMTSESDNGFIQLAVQHKVPALVIGQSPALVAAALRAAIAVLHGQAVPRDANIPFNPVTTSEMKEGVNYFPDQPSSFVTNINIPQCGIHIPVSDAVIQH